MSAPRIGSLFSGYGGLDLGTIAALGGGEIQWHVEWEAAPSKILKHHWPEIPNYGDVSKVDWANVPPVDVLTGGFPCQDVSLAGRRAGLTSGTRSGLWSEFARAIDVLRPRLVVIENVRGLLSATADGAVEPDPWGMGDGSTRPVVNALGAVLGDLASLGYDARWLGLRAADAGAPHGRYRVFILARPAYAEHVLGNGAGRAWHWWAEPAERPRRSPAAADADDVVQPEDSGEVARGATSRERAETHGGLRSGNRGGTTARDVWGSYRAAVARWERVTGRVAPAPTKGDGKAGQQRLSAEFVEWMMGLPAGHVTGTGISRNEQLKALGNGVVPQQAELAIRTLLAA